LSNDSSDRNILLMSIQHCFLNCRCFRFKTNRWSTNMYCSGNNSFISRLKLEVPGLVTLNFICHSSALVASKACEQLSQSCENLIRNVSTNVSGSAKRCVILDKFQEFFNVERNTENTLREHRNNIKLDQSKHSVISEHTKSVSSCL